MSNCLNDVRDMVVALCDASQKPDSQRAIAGAPGPDKLALCVQGDIASYLAAAHVFLYEETSDKTHLERAREYLRLPLPVAAFAANAFWTAVNGLRDNGFITDEDDAHLYREALKAVAAGSRGHFTRTPGFRVFNHAVTTASLADVVYRLWPDSAQTQRHFAQAEEVWREWWILGENIEGAPNYESFAQCHVLQWAKRRGELDRTLTDPRTLEWIDRGTAHIPPIGFIPGFGDSHSTELWADWFDLLCMIAAWLPGTDAATMERRGRAKSAAERIFTWYRDHDWQPLNTSIDDREDTRESADIAHRLWWHVAWMAYYLAEGRKILLNGAMDIRPVPNPVLPEITHRTMPTHDLIRNESWSLIPPKAGQRTPDKGLLRLGTAVEAPFCMFGLARQYWHDHMDIGAISNYSVDGKVFLDDNGYFPRLPVDHNLFFAARQDERWLAYAVNDWPRKRAKVASFGPSDFQVRGLTGRNVAQMIVAECRGPNEQPIYSERTVILGRVGELVVRDRIIPYSKDIVGSPIWHTQHVRGHGAAEGAAWAEVEIVDFCGGNGLRARQRNARLLIVDPLHAVAKSLDDGFAVTDQTKPDYTIAEGMPEAARSNAVLQRNAHVTRQCLHRRRLMNRGEPNHFITVLLPSMRWNTKDLTAPAHLMPESDIGAQTFVLDVNGKLVVLQEAFEAVSGSWGTTDAAVLWCDAEGIMAHRAKHIEVRRPGLLQIGVTSDDMPFDVDVSVVNGELAGHIAAEKPTRIVFTLGERKTEMIVYGIVSVDTRDLTPTKA